MDSRAGGAALTAETNLGGQPFRGLKGWDVAFRFLPPLA